MGWSEQLSLAHAPFCLKSINDPGCRPDVVLFEILKELNDFIPFSYFCNQWTPNEDGVAHDYG